MTTPVIFLLLLRLLISISPVQSLPGTYTSSRQQAPYRIGCDCYSLPDCFTNCSSIPDLVLQLRTSVGFLETLPRPFTVTKPQQIRKKQLRFDTSTAQKRSYFSQAQFRLSILGQVEPIQIRVRKSSVFSGEEEYSTLSYRARNGGISEVESTKMEDCFYSGEVESAPNASFVAVDTCSGLRGAVFYRNTTYVILPLPCPSCDPNTSPHIVLPWTPSPIAQNASLRSFWKPVDLMAMMQASLDATDSTIPDPKSVQHNIWLELVVEANLLREFNDNSTSTLRYMASVVNLVNLHFRDLPVQIHLLRTQLWNLGNRAPIESSIKATLNAFQRYRSEQVTSGSVITLRRSRSADSDVGDDADLIGGGGGGGVSRLAGPRKADISMLLTDASKIEFTEGLDHLAIPGSICTPRGTAVVRVNVSDFEFRVATLVSKSIAEILGIHSFTCPEMYHCDDNEVFSLGDISRLRLGLLSEMSACLRTPNLMERESLRPDSCGNGIIDRGEECELNLQGLPDLGAAVSGNQSVNSPGFGCCDPKTCLADVHAVCVEGGCCRGCQLVARGRLCRPARDQCDLPEFCSGTESECPADLYLENGMPCEGDRNSEFEEEALCYEGRCPTRSSHCKALWGSSSKTANAYCYTNLNKNIDSACGVGVVCVEENTMCGLLHCQNGSDEPIHPEARSLTFYNIRTHHQQQKIQCQYVASTQKFSYVPEGASCSDGRFCFQNRCIKPSAVAVHSKCPRGPVQAQIPNDSTDFIHPAVRRSLPRLGSPQSAINATCSGRGLCTNGAFCLCPPGWHGPSCSQRQPTDSDNELPDIPSSQLAHTSVYPDVDIVVLIWMYLQAVDKNPAELGEPAPVNTIYLVSILAAVIACVFFCLCAIIFIYRRRTIRSRDFGFSNAKADKRNRHLNRFSPPPKFDLGSGKSPGNGTASTTAANSLDSMCLCNRNSRPGVASLDDMELHYHSRHSSSSRSRRHRHGSKSRSRHRHRKEGNSSGDSLQADRNGATESGPELGRDDSVTGGGTGKIKFGSMPSYREDKMKNAAAAAAAAAASSKSPIPFTSGTTTEVVAVTTATSPLIDFTAPWPIPPPPPAFVMTSTSNPQQQMWINSPPPPPPPAPPQQQTIFPLASNSNPGCGSSSGCGSDVAMNSVQMSRKLMTMSSISGEEPLDQFQASAPPMSAPVSSQGQPPAQPQPPVSSSQVTVIRENSCRQPEKGILKNRHEGGNNEASDAGAGAGAVKHKHKHCHKGRKGAKRFSSSESSSGSSQVGSSTTSTNSASCSSSSDGEGGDSLATGRSTGSVCSMTSTSSSLTSSRATDDVNGGGGGKVPTDSESICSTALEVGAEDGRKGRKCRHRSHHHKRSSKRKSSASHRSHSHNSHHHRHHHRQSSGTASTGCGDLDQSPTGTSTSTAATTNGGTSASSLATTSNNTASNSSSTSSPCHRRCHRRRRHRAGGRRYRMSSDDAESSLGGGAAQNHKVPTILCNAEMQTDDISMVRGDRPNVQQQQDPENDTGGEEDGSEWEEVECTGGPDCEECRRSGLSSTTAWNSGANTNASAVGITTSATATTANQAAVPPTPPSSGGLLLAATASGRQYKLPSPPPLPTPGFGANISSGSPYYCTTHLSSQAETDPYYQPPIEDGDSFLGVGSGAEKSGLLGHMKNYSGHAEEDDGLISSGNRGNQGGLTSASMNGGAGGDCYLMNRDSDGLTRKNSPGMNYIARHNYTGSHSDFSLCNSSKKSPTPGSGKFPRQTPLPPPPPQPLAPPNWLSSGSSIQSASEHNPLTNQQQHQWLEVAESDASSLPDASCDLVHLAQLSHIARMNPNLSDLARQQERIRLGAEANYYPKQA